MFFLILLLFLSEFKLIEKSLRVLFRSLREKGFEVCVIFPPLYNDAVLCVDVSHKILIRYTEVWVVRWENEENLKWYEYFSKALDATFKAQ